VFVDGVFRKEVSRLDKMGEAEGWQAGSIHDFKVGHSYIQTAD
jgi:hypothetical protein